MLATIWGNKGLLFFLISSSADKSDSKESSKVCHSMYIFCGYDKLSDSLSTNNIYPCFHYFKLLQDHFKSSVRVKGVFFKPTVLSKWTIKKTRNDECGSINHILNCTVSILLNFTVLLFWAQL